MLTRIVKLIFTLLITLCTIFLATAQPALSYVQYMDNLTPYNASYVLVHNEAFVSTAVQKQWIGINGSPTLFMFNGAVPINGINGSAGLTVNDNELAVEHSAEVNVFFAKSIKLGETTHLGVSLSGGFRQYVTNYHALDPNDPEVKTEYNEVKANAGFGAIFYTENYYVGVSIPELTIRNLGYASLLDNNNFRNHYYLAGGAKIDLDEDFKLSPAALISYSRGVPLISDISTKLYMKEKFGLGINYRTNNELAALLSYEFDTFHMGYSYGFGASSANIGSLSNATHELVLIFHFPPGNRVPAHPGN